MYLVDVNKDMIFFLDLQSIRDDEATLSKELVFFNGLTDVLITSQKTRFEVANSGKTKQPSFSENIQKLPFSLIRSTDYSKGFLQFLFE